MFVLGTLYKPEMNFNKEVALCGIGYLVFTPVDTVNACRVRAHSSQKTEMSPCDVMGALV